MNNALRNEYSFGDMDNYGQHDSENSEPPRTSPEPEDNTNNYQENSPQPQPQTQVDADTKTSKIRVKINHNGEASLYRVPVNKPFRKCIERFCMAKDLPMTGLQFSIDSVPINIDHTPEDGDYLSSVDDDVLTINVTRNLIGGI